LRSGYRSCKLPVLERSRTTRLVRLQLLVRLRPPLLRRLRLRRPPLLKLLLLLLLLLL